jgi:hypothetical protein
MIDVPHQAGFIRNALRLGLIKSDHMAKWAEEIISAGEEVPPETYDLCYAQGLTSEDAIKAAEPVGGDDSGPEALGLTYALILWRFEHDLLGVKKIVPMMQKLMTPNMEDREKARLNELLRNLAIAIKAQALDDVQEAIADFLEQYGKFRFDIPEWMRDG